MKRQAYLAIIMLLGTTSILAGCMSPEQLADTAKRLKEKSTEINEKNPEVPVVFAKRNIVKGAVINDDDVEERNIRALEANMPEDAAHHRQNVVLKKAKNDVTAGQPVCQHDLAPLVQ